LHSKCWSADRNPNGDSDGKLRSDKLSSGIEIRYLGSQSKVPTTDVADLRDCPPRRFVASRRALIKQVVD
jgi:hypothetical protein